MAVGSFAVPPVQRRNAAKVSEGRFQRVPVLLTAFPGLGTRHYDGRTNRHGGESGMSGTVRGKEQPKATTQNDIALEAKARELLAAILPTSIREEKEYGSVICRNTHNGKLARTKLYSDQGLGVDVGLSLPNCGCEADSIPVAFYHTHPTDKVPDGNGGWLHGDPDFSPKDKSLAFDNQLVAFLGSHDGIFRRYVPTPLPSSMVNGKKTFHATDEQGNVLKDNAGRVEILNGKLPRK
jgi:hypothetical protein